MRTPSQPKIIVAEGAAEKAYWKERAIKAEHKLEHLRAMLATLHALTGSGEAPRASSTAGFVTPATGWN